MVCPGPCNPLKAHHHHHHHRHHRRKPDVTSVTTSEEDIFLSEELNPILLLKSLKLDTPSTTSIGDKSISMTSSLTKITLIETSTVAKTSPDEASDAPILRKILSRRELKTFGEPSTRAGEIEPTKGTISPPKGAKAPARYRGLPRTLNDARCIIAEGLNGARLTAIKMSSFHLYLAMFAIYAAIHVLLAVITWRTPAYQFFVSSQICGALAFLMWQITGTILI